MSVFLTHMEGIKQTSQYLKSLPQLKALVDYAETVKRCICRFDNMRNKDLTHICQDNSIRDIIDI